jgi:hypothetical protein
LALRKKSSAGNGSNIFHRFEANFGWANCLESIRTKPTMPWNPVESIWTRPCKVLPGTTWYHFWSKVRLSTRDYIYVYIYTHIHVYIYICMTCPRIFNGCAWKWGYPPNRMDYRHFPHSMPWIVRVYPIFQAVQNHIAHICMYPTTYMFPWWYMSIIYVYVYIYIAICYM